MPSTVCHRPRHILVLNCGSSSLKFAVFAIGTQQPVLSGLAECLGLEQASIIIKTPYGKQTSPLRDGTHGGALETLAQALSQHGLLARIAAVGHRVVHGGEFFNASVLIDDDVIAKLEQCVPLAPLHNPGHLVGIRSAQRHFPALPQVAVFDTSFHQTMPPSAYLYAIPQRFYKQHGVRRYGFHGTSHRYVAERAVAQLGLDPADHGLVIAHLGNGASVTAVRNGASVDTTMGMTPLEGLVMGTRSGDIDVAAVTYVARKEGLDLDGIDRLLNQESGLKGISGLSSDCRVLEEAAQAGHAEASLALDVFAHRLVRHIGGMAMSLHRLDAVVFTGGIGENSALLRANVMARLKPLGLTLDSAANERAVRGCAGIISLPGGPAALVINTNEEWLIARDTAALANIGAPCSDTCGITDTRLAA